MRILTAMDSHSYSRDIIPDVARLAANTWADLTLLGVQQDKNGPDRKMVEAMMSYQDELLAHVNREETLYEPISSADLKETGKGTWQASSRGRKKLTICLRAGDALKSILAQAEDEESDLLILGCTRGFDCEWENELGLPQKVAKEANCSVLVIKEQKKASQISSFLDQTNVSQQSLELINQLVTLHDAGLKIVGLKGQKGLIGKEDVEKKMMELLKYYNERKISAWIKMVDMENLEDYVVTATREGIVALWVGKKSLLSKIFSRDLVGKLVSRSQSSILILR
ncbi:MAG TPA: universal stress protein [Desulfobulbus sp.]|nr:universal stress protein [Desulfobulbus sp.]